MTFIEKIKKLLAFNDNQEDKTQDIWQNRNKIPEIAEYEVRRREIAESSAQINGIFYIYESKIIPDYFSECLASEHNDPRERERYHLKFYENYMECKYQGLPRNEKYLPRGRIDGNSEITYIFVDKCYVKNEEVLSQLRRLYRITGNEMILSLSYTCHICESTDDFL